MTSWEQAYADEAKTHYVYRVFDVADRALYVGCTVDTQRRLAEHRRTSAWWPFAVRFQIDDEPHAHMLALACERREIRRLHPVFLLGHGNREFYDPRAYSAAERRSA